MIKSPFDKIKLLMEVKKSLSLKEKKKLLYGLKLLRRNLDKSNLNEDMPGVERKVVAKTFTIKGDFDPFINQNRGIQFSQKEMDTIANFKKVASPSAQDQFFVRFESSDDFGNNTTTVIKKHRQGNQFVFTAFTKHDLARPQEPTKQEAPKPQESPKMPVGNPKNRETNQSQPSQSIREEVDPSAIIITKTIPFQDDMKGSDILADFLRKLDI